MGIFIVSLTTFALGLALIAGGACPAAAETGVPANVLLRTKRIVSGAGSGTAFTIDVDSRQYLITAKHIMAQTVGTEATVRLCDAEAKCNDVAVSILRCADPVDITVLVPDHQLTVTFELVPEASSMIFGQEMFFVGFPYGDTTLNTNTPDGDLGFIRRATLSAQEKKPGWARLYLDGRNNPGFSGSPIVYRDLSAVLNCLVLAANIFWLPDQAATAFERYQGWYLKLIVENPRLPKPETRLLAPPVPSDMPGSSSSPDAVVEPTLPREEAEAPTEQQSAGD